MNNDEIVIESHPFEPFLPEGAKLLMLGTFPPKSNRWSMNFFYPNKINDFWRIMGEIFYSNKDFFWDEDSNSWILEAITDFLTKKHIAMWDTAAKVRRLRDNASDKFLEIVEPINLRRFFEAAPRLHSVVTTGEKAASVIASLTDTEIPAVGGKVQCGIDGYDFVHYRMCSTSRAYPLAFHRKTEIYRTMFRELDYDV